MSYSLPLNELLSVFAIESNETAMVTSLALNSRKVSDGCVFFACDGHAADGRDYVLEAEKDGAIAVVYEASNAKLPDGLKIPAYAVHGLAEMVGYAASAFYREPSKEIQVFGVTGTNGKTTCCYLLAQALDALGMNAGMIGTLGAGRLNELSGGGLTTPGPIAVHRALASFRDSGVTQVAMEVSSHALDQGRVNGVDFFCNLFTNLTRDHLDYHGDMASYGLAKQRLFTDFHSELVIANAADDFGARIIDVADAEFIVQYGQGADVFVDDVVLDSNGIKMIVEGNGVEFDVSTPLIGKVNVPNLEMLIATLLALSTSIEDIKRIVASLKPAPGRMELYRSESVSVVVDYAHTPDALEKALVSVAEHCDGDLWCVFGCGGDRDAGKRPLMGELAAKYSAHAILTNDNPRTESPSAIAEDILVGMKSVATAKSTVILDRAEAIRYAIESAQPGDWVLVAGKGHETTQTIGDQVLPFSDREQIEQVLGLSSVDVNEVVA